MMLSSRVALITGAGRVGGIGHTIARRLAREGANIILADIVFDDKEKLIQELISVGSEVLVLRADVSRANEVKGLVDAILQKFRKVDLLVNNAAITEGVTKPLCEFDEEDVERQMQVTLMGTILCSKTLLPHMISSGYGKIINISSIAGLEGAPNVTVYCAAKAGVIGFTRALAKEVGGFGIRVNAIAPGGTRTPTAIRASIREGKSISSLKIDPEEVAAAVAFLASDQSEFVNGQCINLDQPFRESVYRYKAALKISRVLRNFILNHVPYS